MRPSGTVAPAAMAAAEHRRGGPGTMSGNRMTIAGTQVRLGIMWNWM